MLNLAWPGESKGTIHQTASEKVQIRNGKKSAGVDETFGYSCRMTGNSDCSYVLGPFRHSGLERLNLTEPQLGNIVYSQNTRVGLAH